jgi:hypothetical protein
MADTKDQTIDGARTGDEAKLEAVKASDLEAAPASQTTEQGSSFYNPALTGSGTILPDGTYGAPLPDPNVKRLAEDPGYTTEVQDADPNPPANAKGSVRRK